MTGGYPEQAIAITGMSCRFPGAHNVGQFWDNLRNGVESITFYSHEELRAEGFDDQALADPNFVPATGELANSGLFDAAYFGYSPREAEMMDPQHRLFLECAAEALERANVVARPSLRVAVLGGAGSSSYLLNNVLAHPEMVEAVGIRQVTLGNSRDYLATQVAYKLDLIGPALTVQTACSTSLVAVHLACRMLLTYEADVALAGGATVNSPQRSGYLYTKGGIASPDGHCRAFDADGAGPPPGSGVGVVVLKRLEDARECRDVIHAVILGSAINNDGATKVGFTAPSISRQADVIAEALEMAQLSAETIGYVEGHGTATALGDPVEVAALTRAFRRSTAATGFCALGSVKSNFGHLDAAAGVAGLIKVVLALEHQQIPPSLNFASPNPRFDLAQSPFFVNTSLRPWTPAHAPRRAGVSSFGVGGTNVHVVVQEAPTPPASVSSAWPQLLTLSAKTPAALTASCLNLAEHLQDEPDVDLADVAHTLWVGRRCYPYRRAVVATTREEAVEALRRCPAAGREALRRPVVFMFPGVSAVPGNIAAELYPRYPVFRDQIDACASVVNPRLGIDLVTLLCLPGCSASALAQPARAACATFAVEYATARLLFSWGITPRAMVGHSMGEYTAACLADVLAVPDALSLVALRYELLERLPEGAMLSVPLPVGELDGLLTGELAVAAHNAPRSTVVSGPAQAIDALAATLSARQVEAIRLAVPVATHSPMLEPLLGEFSAALTAVPLGAPTRPYVSSLAGTWVTADQVRDPGYWVRQFREPVRFADALSTLAEGDDAIHVEVGPGHALTTLARLQGRERPVTALSVLPGHGPALGGLLAAVGSLWCEGVDIAFAAIAGDEDRRLIQLPTYPFERQNYWLTPGPLPAARRTEPPRQGRDVAEWFTMPSWRRAPLPLADPGSGGEDTWLLFQGRSAVCKALGDRLARAGGRVIVVHAGKRFSASDGSFTIDPARPDHYQELLEELKRLQLVPRHVVHTWTLDGVGQAPLSVDGFEDGQARGFFSVLDLVRACDTSRSDTALTLWLVSCGVHDVTGGEELRPGSATLLGPARAIPEEYPFITCHAIDVAQDGDGATVPGRVADQLAAECLAQQADPVVAYRGPHRWVPTLEKTRIERPAVPALRRYGVYVITGGLDRYGAALAEHLTSAYKARLAVIEPEFPAEERWDGWLAGHPAENPVSQRISLVRRLRASGATVVIVTANIARAGEVGHAVSEIRQRLGEINGVVHTADLATEGSRHLIQSATAAAYQEQFQRGAHSILALAQALAGQKLDFCLVQTKSAAPLGGPGQVASAATSAYAGALVHALRREEGDHWLIGNWDEGPREALVGAGADRPVPTIPPLSPAEIAEATERLVAARSHGHLVVSCSDISSCGEWTDRAFAGGPDLNATMDRSHARPDLVTAYETPRNQIEAQIAGIWQEALGVEPLGVHDDFFALGGHSLIGIQIVARLRRAFDVDPPLADLFAAPTVAEQAQLVVQLQAAQVGDTDLSRLLEELERSTSDEGKADRRDATHGTEG